MTFGPWCHSFCPFNNSIQLIKFNLDLLPDAIISKEMKDPRTNDELIVENCLDEEALEEIEDRKQP